MAATNTVLTLFLFIFIINDFQYSQAAPNATGYKCPTKTNYPCETYAFYRASSPDFLDLASIADLFQVSRLMISEPSNISSPSSPLYLNQPLFVPLTCACNPLNQNESLSYANITYKINFNDNFYAVSVHKFRNLTTHQATKLVTPTQLHSNLTIGVVLGFPIFCKCPDQNLIKKHNASYLITYIYQLSDSLSSVAELFDTTVESIIDVNGNNTQPYEAIFVPVSKIPQLAQSQSPQQPDDVGLSMPPTGNDDDSKGIVVGLSVALGVCGVLLIGSVCWGKKSKQRAVKQVDEEKQERVLLGKNNAEMGLRRMEDNLMADVSDCLDKFRVFKIDELREATNGFDESFLIEGSVYSGCIDCEVYAIKKMKWNACVELKILQKVNHANLVRLEGFCIDPEDGSCYLLYEYVQRGSLHWWLHQSNNSDKLSWRTRLKIAIDVSNGLQYIHEHTREIVVHKDITSSNILLDTNMRAKISKFGLAKSGCNAMTMHIVGTQGYIAPEYAADGMVSTKMDVFSFGVVLLELVSGKDVVDENGKVLWASMSKISEETEESKTKKLIAFLDEFLFVGDNTNKDSVSMASVWSVINVAVACVNRDPTKRPSMVDIVHALCKSDDLLYIY